MTKCVLTVQLVNYVEYFTIYSAHLPKWANIWDIFEKSSHHMSIVHGTKYVMQQRCHGKRVVEVPNDLK